MKLELQKVSRLLCLWGSAQFLLQFKLKESSVAAENCKSQRSRHQ